MKLIGTIFQVGLYQPLFNALVVLYQSIPGKDFGVAIIVLTLLYRFALYPLSAKAIRAQKALAEIQPKVQEIQKKYKGNKDELTRKTLELYRQEKVNPFAGIVPLLLQFPIIIALYQVFQNGLRQDQLHFLYGFVPRPEHISPIFLGLVNLSEKAFSKFAFQNQPPFLSFGVVSWAALCIALLAGVFQFVQSKQALSLSFSKQSQAARGDTASKIQSQMTLTFPLITAFLALQFPAAIGLYWVTTSVFSIWQQWYLMKKLQVPKTLPSGDLPQGDNIQNV